MSFNMEEHNFAYPKANSFEEDFAFSGRPIKASRRLSRDPFGLFKVSFSGLPSSTIEDVSWSPDGRFACIACSNLSDPSSVSSTSIYYYDKEVFTKISNFGVGLSLPGAWSSAGLFDGANSYAVAWSPDGTKFAVGTDGSYKVNIYFYNKIVNGFYHLTQPAPPQVVSETARCEGLAWSPDSQYLCAALSGEPYAHVYKVFDDRFETFKPMDRTYSVPSFDCDWSPDGRYLAMTYTRPPYIGVYEFDGKNFKKLRDPLGIPGGVLSVSWSPDGQYLLAGHLKSPAISLYSFKKKKLTRLAISPTRPSTDMDDDICYSVAWSPDGRYFGGGFAINPFVSFYELTKTYATRIPLPQAAYPGPVINGTHLEWSPDGETVIFGQYSSRSSTGRSETSSVLKIGKLNNTPS